MANYKIEKGRFCDDRNKWICVLRNPYFNGYDAAYIQGGSAEIVERKITKQLEYWKNHPYVIKAIPAGSATTDCLPF